MEDKKPKESVSKSEENNREELKSWHAPKLVIEDTENTRGGSCSFNSPGDDTWYAS